MSLFTRWLFLPLAAVTPRSEAEIKIDGADEEETAGHRVLFGETPPYLVKSSVHYYLLLLFWVLFPSLNCYCNTKSKYQQEDSLLEI